MLFLSKFTQQIINMFLLVQIASFLAMTIVNQSVIARRNDEAISD